MGNKLLKAMEQNIILQGLMFLYNDPEAVLLMGPGSLKFYFLSPRAIQRPFNEPEPIMSTSSTSISDTSNAFTPVTPRLLPEGSELMPTRRPCYSFTKVSSIIPLPYVAYSLF